MSDSCERYVETIVFLEQDSAFHQEVRRECRCIPNDRLVDAGYEETAFRKFCVEELNVAESDRSKRVIILQRYARHRCTFASVDDPFAELGLRLRHRCFVASSSAGRAKKFLLPNITIL